MTQLTERQAEIYQFILDYCCQHGSGPSVRDIGEYFGIGNTNGVVCHLTALQNKGWIVGSQAITGQRGFSRMIRPKCGYQVQAVN